MADVAETAVVIADFRGLVSNVDAKDADPSNAIVQVNATSIRVGELRVRMGLKAVTFEDED